MCLYRMFSCMGPQRKKACLRGVRPSKTNQATKLQRLAGILEFGM